MFSETLKKILARESLSFSESSSALEFLLSDNATDAQIAALLIALAAKGETADELAGFASVMRSRSSHVISKKHTNFIDTCGTGGSTVKTFNVSTAAAFIVSACGVPVAKHGNVGVTSKSGSADVLKSLGVNINMPLERVSECFDEIGICFMFAPFHHAATKRVAMIRRELGVRTIFNFLGPLTNPAAAPFQVIGVSDAAAVEREAQALHQLGIKKAWVVRGDDGLDEISIATSSVVYEVTANGVEKRKISPEDFGIETASLENLKGGSADENAATIRAILSKTLRGAALDLVLINAAASLYVAGKSERFEDCTALARVAVESGQALNQVNSLIAFSNS
jgi:anthranilate phosphoribosyltransferase